MGSERVEEGDEISLFLADETIESFRRLFQNWQQLRKRKRQKFGKSREKRGKWKQEEKTGVIYRIRR